MVLLGDKSERLPEIFALARKAVSLYGGEFSERVHQISMAYETGNARILRSIGVTVQADLVLRKYAASVGLTKDQLSPFVQKQVLANAALEQTHKKLDGLSGSFTPISKSIQQMKVAFSEVGESVAVATNKMFGPTFRSLIGDASFAIQDFSLKLKGWLGLGSDEAGNKLERLRLKITQIEQDILSVQAREGLLGKLLPQSAIDRTVERLREMKAKLLAEIKGIEEQKEKGAAYGPQEAPKGRSEEEIQMERDILTAKKEGAVERTHIISQLREMEFNAAEGTKNEQAALSAYVIALKEEEAAKIAEIESKGPKDTKNFEEKKLLIHAESQKKIQDISAKSAKNQQKTYSELLSSMNAGQQALTVGLVAGFKNLAKGGKEAAKEMKKAFLNMLADRAEGEGELKIASGIFPPNPGLLASGAALLALGGILRGAAGGAEGGSISRGAGGGAGSYGEPPQTIDVSQRPDIQTAQQAASRGRSVTIAISGNYFETAETRRALMEMIRQETDATAFQYVQIPQGTA